MHALQARLGDYLYLQRMNIQAYHAAKVIGQGRTLFHPENLPLLRTAITIALKCTLLYGWCRTQALDVRVERETLWLPRLPQAFEGYRILHISDTHFDMAPGLCERVLACLKGLDYDCCVFTGDYRGDTWGPWEAAVEETRRLLAHLRQPVYGVLGNHDFLEMVPPLEAAGLRLLLNEHVVLERDGAKLYLAGVDDPHFYETDRLEQALSGVPMHAPKILLSHTAELYRRALACGVDLVLCGHTHAGQLCLPGGVIVLHNAKHPRRMNRGFWRYQKLQGYTSPGAGCSLLPVRLFSPPAITLLTLLRGNAPEAPQAG